MQTRRSFLAIVSALCLPSPKRIWSSVPKVHTLVLAVDERIMNLTYHPIMNVHIRKALVSPGWRGYYEAESIRTGEELFFTNLSGDTVLSKGFHAVGRWMGVTDNGKRMLWSDGAEGPEERSLSERKVCLQDEIFDRIVYETNYLSPEDLLLIPIPAIKKMILYAYPQEMKFEDDVLEKAVQRYVNDRCGSIGC